MRFPALRCFLPGILSFLLLGDIVGAQGLVGIFDAQADVGRPRPGSASYEPQRQTYLVAGSGQNMWGDHDDFHFVWKRMTGNFILSTRARLLGPGVEPHRKIGWTIRPSLETKSAHVTAALHGDGLMSLQFRRTTGAVTEEAKSRDSLPNSDAVIQLERRDGVYIMSVARFGDTLVTQELAGVSLPDTVYVGLFACAHNNSVMERATFSNVRITTPAKRDLVAYRDYLGSNLEILDVKSGNATIVHQYHGSFQAPNWTRDGKALIYAQEGRLYRFDIASRSAQAINTGFATRNNNDHVLSFDGRMMAISHHAVEDSGASIIYTVPTTGGTPKRVTAKGPSYLHGWSPDARWLVFTGIRGDELDVYKVAAAGGDEIRLTSAPGLDDGPEFTPDGSYIYFNSSRSGRMQIWRMRPDGSGQQQVTSDGFNNWFPHISPDGKWIVYLSFPPDVAADDHPFYKHVLLRLMPIGGGTSRVIAYVYGGQGTINVPSWSPDGTRLAFVSNSTIPAAVSPGSPGGAAALRSTIAFVSTRHDPTADPMVNPQHALLAAEIYLMNGDGTSPRRLTENAYFDGFPALSPDGRRVVFDSNRRRSEGEPFNISDVFVMNADGTGQTLLIRGSSATWSPDGRQIAFHASASGNGRPIKPDPGAATSDNDIFVLNVDDGLTNGAKPRNITNSPEAIDDDPDWSPNGQRIVFTSHAVTDDPINSATAEIYALDLGGTGKPQRLTNNKEEERAPAWSPDGKRIVFSCRRGGPDFEICVMNADGTGQVQLTDNDVPDLTATWSPDGKKIVFHRRVGGRGQFQLFLVNADGTGEVQLTFPPGINAFPNWGEVRD